MEKSPQTGDGLDTGVGALSVDPPAEETEEEPQTPDQPVWAADVAVAPLSISLDFGTVESSSRLKVNWAPEDDAVAYEVTAQVGSHEVSRVVDADTRRVVLTGLRSDTTYAVTVSACEDEDCWRSVASPTVEATTGAMSWLIMGEGSSFNTATPIIEDSDTKGYGLFYGDDAPTGIAGTIQLYYDSNRSDRKGVNIATSIDGEEGVSEMVAYEMVESYGLQREHGSNGTAKGPSAHQAVPMTGGGIRLFFEGQLLGDDVTRLYYLDSQDGDRGQDFHPGVETTCRAEEIVMGGACAPVVALGVSEDGNQGIASVRQSKLVYPMFDDWRWDKSRGSAMLTTVHLNEDARQCSSTHHNMGMASWNGTQWELGYDTETGCPQVISGVQSPMPVHMGHGRYMVLFNGNTSPSSNSDTNKPLFVLYADAAATGDPDVLEWSDFEDRSDAREIVTYWPNGIELPDVMERKLDDFGVFSPTGEADNLVMYANMSCNDGSCEPFIGQLVWINP